MTSREIAELTGKEHRHVVRDIESMFAQLEMSTDGYAQNWTHPQNQQEYRGYALSEDLTLTLVSGYNVALRMRIIKRWKELESAVAPKFQVPTSMAAALRLAADQADIIEAQAAELAAAAPSVEFVARYADSTGLKGFREVCKLLKANEARFREFLLSEKIMYRLNNTLMPYQNHMDAGRFEVKAGTTGENGHAYNSARFTPKGVTWVAGEFAKYQLEASTEG